MLSLNRSFSRLSEILIDRGAIIEILHRQELQSAALPARQRIDAARGRL
jgi:hypothetical protein